MEPGAVPEPPGGSLPAAVDQPSGRLLPVQRPGRRLVPPELGAALPVAVGGAGLPVEAAVMAAGARRQPLGDVLGVGGGAPLGGAPGGHKAELLNFMVTEDNKISKIGKLCKKKKNLKMGF